MRLRTLALLFLLTACAAPPPDLRWRRSDAGLPPHLPVTSIVFDPHTPDHIVAGVYDPVGIYESFDRGRNWRMGRGPGHALHRLVVDRLRPDVLLAATADGLYRSEDGRTWRRLPDWPAAAAAFTVVQTADGSFLAGGEHPLETRPVLWRSADGETWRQTAPLPAPARNGTALLAVAATPQTLLVGTDGAGLFLSEDGGRSWQWAEAIGATFVAALWTAPWDPALVLARTRRGLFRSRDGGHTWKQARVGLPGRVDALAAGPQNAILLGMGTGVVLRSDDAGITWNAWGDLGRDGLFYTLAADPTRPHVLYAGSRWGLHRSDDGGQTWRFVPQIGSPDALALAQASNGTLYLGNSDGLFRSRDAGENWQPWGDGLPRRAVRALAIHPADPSLLFAGTDVGVYRSRDGGVTWESIGWGERAVPGLAVDPSDPDRLLIRLAFERIYSTNTASASEPIWTARWEGMSRTTEVLSLAVSPHDPRIVYAGAAVALFKSEDGGRTWRRIGSELAGQSVFALAVDPRQPQRVYAGATNGLYRSDDGGKMWQRIGLEDVTVSALAFHPTLGNLLYAGTKYRGVWRSRDGGRRWQFVSPDFADVTVHALLVSADGRRLFAATEKGFWRGEGG